MPARPISVDAERQSSIAHRATAAILLSPAYHSDIPDLAGCPLVIPSGTGFQLVAGISAFAGRILSSRVSRSAAEATRDQREAISSSPVSCSFHVSRLLASIAAGSNRLAQVRVSCPQALRADSSAALGMTEQSNAS